MEQLQTLGTPKDCPVVALFNENSEMLVGLRHYTPDKWKTVSVWTIPGGRSDDGDTLEKTLRRETEEEVGITEFQIINFLGTVPGAKEGDIVHVFTGNTTQKAKLMEPEKFSEWTWMKPESIPDNFINPEVLELIKKYTNEQFN